MTAPITLTLRTLAVTPFADWKVSLVRGAIDSHENGDFGDSALLVDAFGRNDRIAACLQRRCGALASKRGLPFEVQESEYDGRRGKALAAKCEQLWWTAHDEACIRRVLRDAITLGVCVGWIDWQKDGKQWAPKLMPLHASNLRWDEFAGNYKYRTQTGDLVVTPGDGNWFLYTPGGEAEPWMTGAVRSLGIPHVLRSMTWADWARWSERHGLPTIKAKIPASEKPAQAKSFLDALRGMGSDTVIGLPQGDSAFSSYDIDVLEAKDAAHEGFRTLLERIDVCVAVLLLGQNLTTEVQAGAYASSQVHKEIEGAILAGDAESLSTALREQVWKPWALFNYGDAELAPWGSWDVSPPEDRKSIADTLNVFGDAMTKLSTLQLPVDLEEMADRFGVPLRKGARVPEPEAPDPDAAPEVPPAPPPPPPPNEGEGKKPVDETPAATSMKKLDTKTPREASAAMRDGQGYVDGVREKAAGASIRAMAPDVRATLAAIADAKDYDEMKARLLVAFGDMSPAKLSELHAKAIVLAELAGRRAMQEET